LSEKNIVKRNGKLYLKDEYYDIATLFLRVAVIYSVLILTIIIAAWFLPAVDEGYYLRVSDAGKDESRNFVTGEIYRFESLSNGGMHPVDEDSTVYVSGFVYDQVEVGNMISVEITGDDGYRYTGHIYSSIDVFGNVQDFIDTNIDVGFLLLMLFAVVGIYYLFAIKSNRVIKVSKFHPFYKEDRWFGKFLYGRGIVNDEKFYKMICIKDTFMFLEDGSGVKNDINTSSVGIEFYTINSRFKIISDINSELEDLIDPNEEIR